MGVSLYPVLEHEVAGYDATAVVGKAFAHAVYNWPIPALVALGDFFSVSPEEVASLAGYYLPGDEDAEEGEGGAAGRKPAPPDFQPPAEAWYEPTAGLNAVREALRALREAPASVTAGLNTRKNRVEWVISDLEAVERVLLLAQEQEVRFHFAMDI
ncbi:MAG: hypothetical protein JO250_17865 [Armatimonadetes bacterium]|nr:hypothetical protein [Armatimonadota bacterium]